MFGHSPLTEGVSQIEKIIESGLFCERIEFRHTFSNKRKPHMHAIPQIVPNVTQESMQSHESEIWQWAQ